MLVLLACIGWPGGARGQGRALIVAGSWSGLRANESVGRAFAGASGVRVGVHGRDNARGFEYLAAGDMHVLMVSPQRGTSAREAVDAAFGPDGPHPAGRPVGRFVTCVVVHPTNTLSGLSTARLRDVLAGRITDWEELRRERGRIVLVGEAATSKSREMLARLVMGGQPFSRALARLRDDAAVIAHVAADRNAIGFFLHRRDAIDRVKVVPLRAGAEGEFVPPTAEHVFAGRYPLIEDLWLYLPPDPLPEAEAYVEFALGTRGARALGTWFLYPEYDRQAFLAETRVADAKAGKGQPVAVCDLAGVGEALNAPSYEFARAHEPVQVTLDTAGGSVERAVERLETGAAELLVMDGRLDEPVWDRLAEAGGAETVLGSRAVGVVVHPQNPFNELALDDVRQILSGEVDRWPGLTGTAERIVLYGLPAASPLTRMVDETIGLDRKRAPITRRPDTGRVILSVAAQPGAMGLVDLTEFPRHETKVKLLAILPPGERQALPPAPEHIPDDYPFAQPVHLYLSGKASDAAKAFFAFVAEGNAREGLLAHGVVPRAAPPRERTPQTEAMAVVPADFRDVVLGESEEEPEEVADDAPDESATEPAAAGEPEVAQSEEDAPGRELQQDEATEDALEREPQQAAPIASNATTADAGIEAWVSDNALLLVLIGLGVLAIAVTLGSATMKRGRRRNDLLRRYRP